MNSKIIKIYTPTFHFLITSGWIMCSVLISRRPIKVPHLPHVSSYTSISLDIHRPHKALFKPDAEFVMFETLFNLTWEKSYFFPHISSPWVGEAAQWNALWLSEPFTFSSVLLWVSTHEQLPTGTQFTQEQEGDCRSALKGRAQRGLQSFLRAVIKTGR